MSSVMTPTPQKSHKKEVMEEITKKLIEKVLDMVNQKVQEISIFHKQRT
jgi:Mg2+/Co2+ transporter CorC